MNAVMMRAFVKEAMALQVENGETPPDYVSVRAATMRKLAMGNLGLASSVAGLGVLGHAAARELQGKPLDEKRKAKEDLLGLTMIGVPEAHELYHGSKGHFGGLARRLKGAAGKVRA